MRVVASEVLALVACLACVGVATAGRSPRLERIALRGPDMMQVRSATVRLSDLIAGWKGGTVNPNNDSSPDCSSQNFSPFTITGQAESDYHHGVTLLISLANMYPSTAQSLGDFTVGTQAGTVECEGGAFRKAFGGSARLVSARQITAPKVGQHAAAFEYIVKTGKTTFYSQVIQFVRGRALGALISVNPGHPLAGPMMLARVMDERLQSGIA
jgi:hypothetical protein